MFKAYLKGTLSNCIWSNTKHTSTACKKTHDRTKYTFDILHALKTYTVPLFHILCDVRRRIFWLVWMHVDRLHHVVHTSCMLHAAHSTTLLPHCLLDVEEFYFWRGPQAVYINVALIDFQWELAAAGRTGAWCEHSANTQQRLQTANTLIGVWMSPDNVVKALKLSIKGQVILNGTLKLKKLISIPSPGPQVPI